MKCASILQMARSRRFLLSAGLLLAANGFCPTSSFGARPAGRPMGDHLHDVNGNNGVYGPNGARNQTGQSSNDSSTTQPSDMPEIDTQGIEQSQGAASRCGPS